MMRHGKAFPHRIVAMINDAGYEKLKEESLARGYQIALIERWMLIPKVSRTCIRETWTMRM